MVGRAKFGLFIYFFSRILRFYNLKKGLNDLKVISRNNQVILAIPAGKIAAMGLLLDKERNF